MSVNDFLEELSKKNIPLHGFILWQNGEIRSSGSCPQTPIHEQHRMFSISKSVTAIAIGLLISDGVNIDSQICRSFIDKYPRGEEPDSRIRSMTIKDLLMMRTAHSFTTYKVDPSDYTGSFFTVRPVKDPGTLWAYDTSAAHVLAAFVQRTGSKKLLDYLRDTLPELKLSKDAYFINDPQGSPMGGTGLVCTGDDILSLSILLYDANVLPDNDFASKYKSLEKERALKFKNYLMTATSCLSPTASNASGRFDSFGYGYMIWRTDHNGFMLYGMGGQFAAIYPDKKTIFITTADTQGLGGANDMIFDAFYRHIFGTEQPVTKDSFTLSLPLPPGKGGDIRDCSFELSENSLGFTSISFDMKGEEMMIHMKGLGPERAFEPVLESPYLSGDLGSVKKEYTLTCGLGTYSPFTFAGYNLSCYGTAMWQDKNILLIRILILDEYMGSITMTAHFSEDFERINVFLKKTEESLFWDFSGYLTGTV